MFENIWKKDGKTEISDSIVYARALYNSALIKFRMHDIDDGISKLKSIIVSESSYSQLIILSSFLYYCGYFSKENKLHLKDTDLFHVKIRRLKQITKNHLKSTYII